jgi:hypothetical protein
LCVFKFPKESLSQIGGVLNTKEYNGIEPGDIIFVYSKSTRGSLNLASQQLFSLYRYKLREMSIARYTHVLLALDYGLVIHADGTSTVVESFPSFISDYDINKVKIVRMKKPCLSRKDKQILINEALRYFKQKYTLYPGRNTISWISFMTQKYKETNPFCSELLALVFKAIDRPLCDLPPDQVLPIDIEKSCLEPVWENITKEIFEFSKRSEGSEDILLEKDILALFDDFEKDSQRIDSILIRKLELSQVLIKELYRIFFSSMRLCSLSSKISVVLVKDPGFLLSDMKAIFREDMLDIFEFYEKIKIISRGDNFFPGSMFKDFDLSFQIPVPELLPSILKVKEYGLMVNELTIISDASRLWTEFLCLLKGMRFKEKFHNSLSINVTYNQIACFLDDIPLLSSEKCHELLSVVDKISLKHYKNIESEFKSTCSNIIRSHVAISAVIIESR